MNKTTLLCSTTFVFILLTVESFSQNANLVIRGNGIDIANNDITPSVTDNTDFGTVGIGSTLDNTFIIRNDGTGGTTAARRVTFSNPSVTITGVDAGQFSIISGPASGNTLNGLGTIFSPNLVIRFTPTLAAGTKNATLTVRYTNNGGQLTYTYAIRGVSALAPEMNVQGNATSITDGDVTPTTADWTDFGSTNVGAGITRTFTIQNTGSATLTIGAISFSGANPGDFNVTTAPSANVLAGTSTTFIVTFNPSASGLRTATLSIANNDSNENPYNYSIQGTGLAPEIDVQGNTISIVDGDITPSLTDYTIFTNTDAIVGSYSTRTYTILNTGTAGLNLTGAPVVLLSNNTNFTVLVQPATSVTAPTGTTTFTIQFNSLIVGTFTSTVTILNNDYNELTYDFVISGTAIAPLTYGPGGRVTDLKLWLRADLLDGTTGIADNTNVATWNTQGRGNNATRNTAGQEPKYWNNATKNVNFNSVVDFTNNYNIAPAETNYTYVPQQYLEGTSGYYSQEIFVVSIPDVTVNSTLASMDMFCGDSPLCAPTDTDGSGIGYGRYSIRTDNEVISYAVGTSPSNPATPINSRGYGVVQSSTTASYSNVGIINARHNTAVTGHELYYNGNNIANMEVGVPQYINLDDTRYWIGRSQGYRSSLDARVAEIITYSSRKNDVSERNRIESYLAIKYGITLGINGTSMNYTNSDGSVIWDIAANAGFNYDIAGIGRDDISKLNQKQSKSVNTNSMLTIGLGNILATNTANTNAFDVDKKYLVWGSNNASMNDSGIDLAVVFGASAITTLTDIPNRKWKVVENGGDVATTKVSIATADLINLPVLAGTDSYVMVIAADAAFTTGVEMVFLTTNGLNQEGLYDFDGIKYITFGVAHETVQSRHVTLDGTDDNIKIDAVNDISGPFSMMVWIRPNGANDLGNDKTIVSKYNGTTGYKIGLLASNRVKVEWIGGTPLTSNTVLPNTIWHNIAVVYDGTTIRLYIDGVLDASIASASPAVSANIFAIGAEYRNKSDIRNLFKGDLDELRMWNRALTAAELRFVMNQEILQNAAGTRGTIIPTTITKNDINTLNWNNLFAYYSMNSYQGTHINDDSINNNRGSLVVPNKVTVNVQTAPLPYLSSANGLWSNIASWQNGAIQDLPYSLSIVDNTTPVDWNIVKTTHNIDSNGNKTMLGLFVNSNTLSATNDTKLEISHYLRLDGKIDLVGKSQLIQTPGSDLDQASSGSLERDQQGTSNKYNYNYWSSPVGPIGAANNSSYTVNGIFKDGTTPTPQNINWIGGYDGAPTSPVSLAYYWIYKFQNISNDYANWTSVGQNGNLLPAQGFTLKGSGALSANQNYTFVGKPFNGDITSPIAANNLNLSGNPYASAIDSNKFIDDNVSSLGGVSATTGTLYFWEHSTANNTHNLASYQGGYAAYTKTGGTPPVAPAGINGLGGNTAIVKRFIPVGQSFFVVGSATGGTISFNNGQRLFIKEDDAASFELFRNTTNHLTVVNHFENNVNDGDTHEVDTFLRVRLGFNSHNNYHRQILLGFMDENATNGIDIGYDGLHIDNQPNDMYFINGTTKLTIQGDTYFNVNSSFPLEIKTAVEGTVQFVIDSLENFDADQNVFIHDNVTGMYHNIKDQMLEINLPAGLISNRFSLRFSNNAPLNTDSFDSNGEILVAYTNTNSVLHIKNNTPETLVTSVSLFNILGQSVATWNVENAGQQNIQLPIKNLSAGTYIAKVNTTQGDLSKKMIIN